MPFYLFLKTDHVFHVTWREDNHYFHAFALDSSWKRGILAWDKAHTFLRPKQLGNKQSKSFNFPVCI